MKKRIISLVIIGAVAVLAITFIVSVFDSFNIRQRWQSPDYKYIGVNDEMGVMFEVGGNTYRYLPMVSWEPLPDNRGIYCGSAYHTPGGYNIYVDWSRFDIYIFEKDTKRIFIQLRTAEQRPLFDERRIYLVYYYRADISLPSFDRTGIDELAFAPYSQFNYEFMPVTKDTEIINKLFAVVNDNAGKQELSGYYQYYFATLWCMNSGFPGIGIALPVYAYDQDYWVLINYSESISEKWKPNWDWLPEESKESETPVYAKIPQQLLEQIAGEKLPTASEYIASKQKTAG